MSNLFIGVDAGGTRTHALLTTAGGEIVGSGRAGGANSWSSGVAVADAVIASIADALRGTAATEVRGGVIAIAGGAATDPRAAADLSAGWQALGLAGTPRIVPDVLAAFAAGTSAVHGVVLAVGTGSIAASVRDGEIERRAGGHGWLVGDEGSAVWLGRKGVQAALRSLDGRGPHTILETTVPQALRVDGADASSVAAEIVIAVYSEAPAHVGQLAQVVIAAAEHGDEVASALTRSACDQLVTTLVAVVDHGDPPVIVLAGSVLTGASSINRGVRSACRERWPDVSIVEAVSGEAGAAAMAIGRHTGTLVDDAALARLRGA